MQYDFVDFNEEFFLDYNKVSFVNFPGNQLLWPEASDKERNAKLGIAWDMLQGLNKRNANRQQFIASQLEAQSSISDGGSDVSDSETVRGDSEAAIVGG